MKKTLSIIAISAITLAVLFTIVYAWATINTKIGIEDIKIKPSENSKFEIGLQNDDESFIETIKATTTTVTLNPVSSRDLNKWYIPKSGASDAGFSEINSSDLDKYCFSKTFTIKSDETLGAIHVKSITITDSEGEAISKDFVKSIRIGFYGIFSGNNASAKIFAPAYTSAQGLKAVGNIEGETAIYDLETLCVAGSSTNDALFTQIVKGETNTQVFTLYVWFEGCDVNCTTANLEEACELNIEIELTADEPAN